MATVAVPAYPWYGTVSGSELEQGDILFNCPVFLISAQALQDPINHPVTVQRQNLILITQSCDLVPRKDGKCAVDEATLLRFFTRPQMSAHPVYGKAQGWEEARKGRHPGFHVLNCCEAPTHPLDYILVDLRRIATLSVDLLREIAAAQSPRLRLLPPYREHLAQSFARFFMRVGLPVDINPFK